MKIALLLSACVAALTLVACQSASPSRVAPTFLGIQLEPETPIGFGSEVPSNLTVDVLAYLRNQLPSAQCAQPMAQTQGRQGATRQLRHAKSTANAQSLGSRGQRARDLQREFSCYISKLAQEPESTRRRIRNDLATQLLHASNVNCRTYLWSLRDTQVGGRLASDIFTSGFTLWGTLNQHLPTAQLLSGLGSFSSAAGASVDRAVFAQAGVEIITNQVIEMRRDGRTRIEQDLQKSYTVYPLGLALADIADYHMDCSLMRGLSQMQEDLRRREEAVLVSRQTALRVMQSGGSGRAVAAAVGGVADVYLGLTPASADPAAPLSPQRLANAPLLDRSRDSVLYLIGEPDASLSPENLTLRIGEAATQLQRDLESRGYVVPLAAPETPPLPQPQHLLFAISALEIFQADEGSRYSERRSAAVARMEQIRAQIVGVRITTAEHVRSLGEVGADAAMVEGAIRGVQAAADSPLHNDPVLAAMRRSIPGEGDPAITGPQLARLALASAIAVIEGEEEALRNTAVASASR